MLLTSTNLPAIPLAQRRIVLYSLASMLFFTPAVYALPGALFRVWQLLTCAVGGVATLLYLTRCRISAGWLSFSLFFCFYYLYASLVSESDGWMVSIAYNAIRAVGFASLVHYSLDTHLREGLLGFIIGGCIMCALNYATFILYRNSASGMLHDDSLQNWYFLGHDNMSVFYYLPVIACALAYGKRYDVHVARMGIVAFVLALAMYVYLSSAAALGATLAFALMVVALGCAGMRSRTGLIRFVSPRQAAVLGFAFAAFVVLLSTSGVVGAIAGQVFDKAWTFRLRQIIWGRAAEQLALHPLFGLGFNAEATRVHLLTFDHAHNAFVQIAFQGGLVGLVLFVILSATNSVGSVVRSYRADVACHVLTACTIALALAGSMDYYPDILPQFYPIMLALYLGGRHDRT